MKPYVSHQRFELTNNSYHFQKILEEDIFARVARLLIGKVALSGPASLKAGTAISQDYLNGLRNSEWLKIKMKDEDINLQLDTVIGQVGLLLGYNSSTNVTHTTPITPYSSFFNGISSGQAKVDSSATVPTAHTVVMPLASTPNATTLGPGYVIDMEGSVILPPGAYATLTGISAIAGFQGFMTWEEVPL